MNLWFFKPGSHCAITNHDSSFDAQVELFFKRDNINMFDIVAIGDRNLSQVIKECEPGFTRSEACYVGCWNCKPIKKQIIISGLSNTYVFTEQLKLAVLVNETLGAISKPFG